MKAYLARQPIYAADNKIFGYELLCRTGEAQNSFDENFDGDKATLNVLSDAVTGIGLEKITHGHPAFVNFTRNLIMDDTIGLLNSRDFIIEILEDTEVDARLIDRVKEYKEQGYVFAIDDYTGQEKFDDIMGLIDIIKVDFMLTTVSERKKIAAKGKKTGKFLLAEKVETEEEFIGAKKMGYGLFQGYYFERPMNIAADRPDVQNATCLRLYAEVTKPGSDFSQMTKIIKTDVNLSYSILKHVNTLRFYRGEKITSVQGALIRMGIGEIKRWVSLLCIREFADCKNDENVKTALARGVFCENIAEILGEMKEKDNAFMTGMFSMLATIMEGELIDILNKIKLSENIQNAILGKEGILGEVLEFIKNYERGNWEEASKFIANYKLNLDKVTDIYIDALNYADSIFD